MKTKLHKQEAKPGLLHFLYMFSVKAYHSLIAILLHGNVFLAKHHKSELGNFVISEKQNKKLDKTMSLLKISLLSPEGSLIFCSLQKSCWINPWCPKFDQGREGHFDWVGRSSLLYSSSISLLSCTAPYLEQT